jgi:hypothetical protein
MKGKTLDFIKENVDYSIRMFDKTEAKALKTLKEEAFEQREVKPDVIIEEKINPQILNNDSGLTNDYISVLDSQSRR